MSLNEARTMIDPNFTAAQGARVDELVRKVERMKAALRPFVALADEIEKCSRETGIPLEAWAKSCMWEDLANAREAHNEKAR